MLSKESTTRPPRSRVTMSCTLGTAFSAGSGSAPTGGSRSGVRLMSNSSIAGTSLNSGSGSLWDALRYEKGIEGMGVSGVVRFFDARGWQALPEGTMLHLPVPGDELVTIGVTNYTFGGIGGASAAPAPAPETCPITLARCP